jgi:hypothetical protein
VPTEIIIRSRNGVLFQPGEYTPTARDDRFTIHVAMLEVDDKGNSAPLGTHVTGQAHNTAPPNGDGPARSPGGVGHETLASVAEPEGARGATGVTALDERQPYGAASIRRSLPQADAELCARAVRTLPPRPTRQRARSRRAPAPVSVRQPALSGLTVRVPGPSVGEVASAR